MAREGNFNKLDEMLEELKVSQSQENIKEESKTTYKEKEKEEQRTIYLAQEQVKDIENIAKNLGVKKFSESIRLVVKAGIKSIKEKLEI